MNAVGIDVSKGKGMVAIMRPGGEVVQPPFEVVYTEKEFGALADRLKQLPGETKVIMEYTGIYYQTIAYVLYDYGLTISAVHPKLIHCFDNNSIRKIKTDKADAIKIANYGLFCWAKLPEWVPEDDLCRLLKAYSRQYNKYGKTRTMLKNNLISLMDQTFPAINELFASKPRVDGHQKWIDFALRFWHCACVFGLTPGAFEERYRKWCQKSGYRFNKEKSENIYFAACGHYSVLLALLLFHLAPRPKIAAGCEICPRRMRQIRRETLSIYSGR